VSVTVVGLSNGDTGFFDPGAGFSNRIAASVSGSGVTVHSVAYVNPTNLNLNVSIAGGAAAGARLVSVTNPDGQGAVSSTGILTITGSSNVAPVLTAISNKIINEGSLLIFTNSASDSPGQTLTFSLEPGAPDGAAVAPTTGVFSWTPTEAQGPANYTLGIRVSDNGSPALSDAKSFGVTVNEVNEAPVLTQLSPRVVHGGTLLSVTNAATDTDLPANTLVYSLGTGAPSWASMEPGTGVAQFAVPDFANPTTNTFVFVVTDNGSPPLTNSRSFALAVMPRPGLQPSFDTNAFQFSWNSIPGQVYRVQYKTNLTDLAWLSVVPDFTATNSTSLYVEPGPLPTTRYFRLMLVP
jgi:hypothetical protein